MKAALAATALTAFAAPASAATVILTVDVSQVVSIGEQFDPANTILEFAVPTDAFVTGIGYDVTLQAFSPSWLSEITVGFLDSGVGLQLTPAVGEDAPGTGTFSSGGLIDLGSIDPDFPFAVTDGFLSLEFFEAFDDAGVSPDGAWLSGTLTFQYETADVVNPAIPEPASWAMMISGFGLVGGAMRRRNSVKVAYAA